MKGLDKSLPILDVVYRLALEFNKAVIKFPRNQRPGLGRKIEDAGFNLLAGLSQARYLNASHKLTVLIQASSFLDNLRLLIRMSFDLGYLPIKKYEELSRVLQEAGRMLGGWQKSQKQSGGGIINEFFGGRNSVFFQSSLRLEDDKEPSCPRRVSSFLF